MIPITPHNISIPGLIIKRTIGAIFRVLPKGKLKTKLRATIMNARPSMPSELLVDPGDTVVLVGFHRIDTVMHWSDLVGKDGRILVIEAVPEYVDNLRSNLEHHLYWPIHNIQYCAKGVDNKKGSGSIEIGQLAGFNKLHNRKIDDGLNEDDFTHTIEIETDTIDNILNECGFQNVDHIHMTISGLELAALEGSDRTLKSDGLRIHIRSLHKQDGELIYSQVAEKLRGYGMEVTISKQMKGFEGRDVYATNN